MVEILSVSTELPEHRVDSEDTKAYLPALVGHAPAARFARMVDASRIRKRHSIAPIAELFRLNTLQARTERYVEHAVTLAENVARKALVAAEVDREMVDVIISVSNTGYMMPSLDAHLIDRLQVNRAARRIPITELGCHAGVGAVGLAAELLHPESTGVALVVSLELCSLCLQVAEPSATDVIGSILFGDGAGAAVLTRRFCARGPEVLATRTFLLPDTLDRAGMRITETGPRLVLSPSLPHLVRARLPEAIHHFLEPRGLRLEDIAFWIVHPGGPKILDAVGEGLHLKDGALDASWAVWEQCGNVASATVFFILRHLQESAPPSEDALGMMMAFGPGVTCEMVLLRSQGWLAQKR